MAIGILSEISTSPIMYIIYYIPIMLFIFYGQKLQAYMILSEVSRSLIKLEKLKNESRNQTIEYVNKNLKPNELPAKKIDQILEYFTIMPISTDPNGIVRKMEHILTVREDRMKKEVQKFNSSGNSLQISAAENMFEISAALNSIYKMTRHFYQIGKRTKSFFMLVQIQMILPMILEMSTALTEAMTTIKNHQPIGDGIGPMIASKFMIKGKKENIAKDTLLTKTKFEGRALHVIKSEGPNGSVGEVGEGVYKLVEDMKIKPKIIIMIDAALKLEGEKTGDIAEGIGAAIGGIGVDKFKIEEVASNNSIPLYAIIVKQTMVDAISVMKKEIAESSEEVMTRITRTIKEKSKRGDDVIIVGVGNTLGVGQ